MRSVSKLLVLICTVTLAALNSGCFLEPVVDGDSVVEYVVSGSAENVSIEFTDDAGAIVQIREYDLLNPDGTNREWVYRYETAEPNFFVSLGATNLDEIGSVTVTIYRDGDVFRVQRRTGSGAYAYVRGYINRE
ncbi:MAG: hypothetical protein AAF752_14315 [Bacteroidota bacterium]